MKINNVLRRFRPAVLFLLFSFSFSVFAVEKAEESWKILQKAQQYYDNNDFSYAMRYTQDALSSRKKESEYANSILTAALNPYQVRRVGDDINEVLNILSERQDYEAIDIINDCIDKLGIHFFHSSIKELKEYVIKRTDYPEAYFLLGKIYKIEGEFDLALNYLEKARATAALLEVPSEEIDILYLMADIAEYTNDINRQEKALILIAQNDGDYRNDTLKTAILRTSKSTKEDNSSRFFKLYRVDAIQTVNAYFKLSDIYNKNKKIQEAYLTNMYGVLICFTHLNSLLEERESEYTFTDLRGFFKELSRYPDMIAWCNENGFWQGFYNIGTYGEKLGFTRFPQDIMLQLSKYCPEEYWKNAAAEKLR